jgi:Tfp pilus assembly protein FimT
MRIQKSKVASGSEDIHQQTGFSILQLVLTVAVVLSIASFAFLGITSARASMRLAGSTRELAGYLEKARTNAIRRNDRSFVTIVDANSYQVDMDFDGDGAREIRTVRLQDGVTFTAGSIGTIAEFDWRGRVPSQIGIILTNGPEMSLYISGSGDITLDSEIFTDLGIGTVNLNSNVSSTVANNNSGSPSPSPEASPSPSPSPEASPSPSPEASPSPSPEESPSPSPEESPSPSPSPEESPSPSPSPSPTPIACTITFPASPMTVTRNSSPKTFSVTVNNANNTIVTAVGSGGFSISPATTTITGAGTISYTLTYGTGNQSGSVTISSLCGSKTISITTN